MNIERFAEREHRDHIIYQELERREAVPEFRKVLQELVQHELKDYQFWLELSPKKKFRVGKARIAMYLLMRKVLGLTFTVRFLERHERRAIEDYTRFAEQLDDPALREQVLAAVDHAEKHERQLISQIDEDRVKFIGNMVLGVNDALISMSGALVGFAFAMDRTAQIGRAGLIMGTAASLSIAASAYMQAKLQKGNDAAKAAIYSGTAFFVVVLLLSAPFFITANMWMALGAMVVLINLLVMATTFYTATVFQRRFLRQFRTMALFGIGTAIITFLIGHFVPVA